jgi:hypothetical protein
MTHPLHVSHYRGVVTAVGLGGYFLCMTIEDEAVAGSERSEFHFRRGVEARCVGDVRATHLLGSLDRGPPAPML